MATGRRRATPTAAARSPASTIERGAVRAVHTALGTIRTSARRARRGRSGARRSPRLAGVRLPLVPVQHQYAVTAPLPELAGETREVVHPILRHQDRRPVLPPGRRRVRHRQLPPRAAAGRAGGDRRARRARAAVDAAVHAGGLRRAPRRRPTGCCPPSAGRRWRAAFNGLMSFTPDGMPLIGEAAAARGLWLCEAIWVTHAGGAGRALAELIVRRRRRASTCTSATRSASTRHGLEPRVLARCAAPSSTARSTTSSTRASSSEQARGCCAGRRCTRARSSSARSSSRAPAGSGRSGSRPTPRSTHGRRAAAPARWPARHWSPIAGGRAPRLRERVGDLRPLAVHEGRGARARARSPSCSASPPTTSTGRSGTIVYTAMLAPRGGIMCDLTITRTGDGPLPGRHRRRGRPARPRVDAPPPAARTARVTLEDRTSGLCCIGVWGPRARDLVAGARRGRRVQRGVPLHDRAASSTSATCRCARCGSPTSASSAGRSTRRPSSGSRCGTRCGGRARRTASSRAAARPTTRCGSRRATGSGARTSTRSTTRTRPGSAGRCELDKGDFIGRETLAAASRRRASRRRLRCLVLDDPTVVLVGKEPILDGDAAVGYVTSAALRRDAWARASPTATCRSSAPRPAPRSSVYAEGERHAATVAARAAVRPAQRAAARGRAGRRRRLSLRSMR